MGGRDAADLVELTQMSVLELATRWFESPHVRARATSRASFLGLPPWAPGTGNAFLLTTAGHGLLAHPSAAIDTYTSIALGSVPSAPGTLVAFSTSVDPGLAPAGHATMWANAVAPCDVRGRTWDEVAGAASEGVWRTIGSCLPDLRAHVVHEVLQ